MNKILLVGLLALAACSKKDPDSSPTFAPGYYNATLLTKWQADSTWVSGGTAATLYQKNNLRLYPTGAISTEITDTQYIVYAGSTIAKQFPYIQAGNVLHIGSTGTPADIYNDQSIKVLTGRRLVLVSLMPQDNGVVNVNSTFTTTYSR
jgi:hypothetical protein